MFSSSVLLLVLSLLFSVVTTGGVVPIGGFVSSVDACTLGSVAVYLKISFKRTISLYRCSPICCAVMLRLIALLRLLAAATNASCGVTDGFVIYLCLNTTDSELSLAFVSANQP